MAMHKRWGDLRTRIDIRMRQLNGNRSAPFPSNRIRDGQVFAGNRVGHEGVASTLQGCVPGPQSVELPYSCFRKEDNRGTELKQYKCLVADYEISVGVKGTGFWRAPEILRAVRSSDVTLDIFSEKSDVCSYYAMTCCEVLTTSIPFDDLQSRNLWLRGRSWRWNTRSTQDGYC